MKNVTRILTAVLLIMGSGLVRTYAQCTQGFLYGTGSALSTCATATTSVQVCHFVNEYARFTGLTIGNTYEIGSNVPGTTSGTTTTTAGAHILTLYDGTGAVLTSQSSGTNNLINITFVATTTEVRAQINTYTGSVCGTSGSYCHYYGLRCLSCPGPGAPACPTTPTPANNATGISVLPTLSWTASTNAASYDVYVSDPLSVDCSSTAVFTNPPVNVTTTSYTLSTPLTASTYYKWYVIPKDCGGAAPGACTQWCFRTTVGPPANDNCTGTNGTPVSLTPQAYATSCSSPVSSTSAGATQTNINCSSTATNDDVWFTFVAGAASQTVRFESIVTQSGTVSSMGMDTYTTCGGTSSNCNTALTITSGTASGTLTGLTIGNTYLLRVWTAGTSNSASFNICIINPPTPPSNDICSGAISVTPVGSCGAIAGNTSGATDNDETGDCVTGTENSVWYSFMATATSHIVTVDGDAGFDPVVNVILACGSATSPAGASCADATGDGGIETMTLTGLTIGNTYYIQVHDFQGDNLPTATFTICVSLPPSMTYTSSAISQLNTGSVGAGSTYQAILRLTVVTANSFNPLSVTQLDFSTAGTPGTSLPADITNARVYYTGTTSTWTDGTPSGTQFGSTMANPSGTIPSFTGSQVLVAGSNYFWLVYDLTCAATGPNLDASMLTNGLSLSSGGPYTPTTNDPATGRTITALSSYTTAAAGNWSNPATWACGVPPNGTTAAININHNVTLDADVSLQSTLTVAASRTLSISTNSLTIGGAGTGTQNLVVNGTVNVSGSTLNVGTATGVTTSNIAVNSGGLFSVSGGVVNLGPTGGYNRIYTGTGTTTISGGTFNVNGSISQSGAFNLSAGNLVIDGNGPSSAGSTIFSLTTAPASVNISGGTVLFVDPSPSATAASVFTYGGATVYNCTGGKFQIGDGVSTTAGSASSGFLFSPASGALFRFWDFEVNGGTGAGLGTGRFAYNNWDMVVQNTLDIKVNGELRMNDDLFVTKNLINNGIITNNSSSYFVNFSGITASGTTPAATTNAISITGTGICRNAASTPTGNFYNLRFNTTNAAIITIPSAMISGQGTGTVSIVFEITAGKVDIGSTPFTLGISTSGLGTLNPITPTSAGYVIGEFRRWRAAATTANYYFPVGTSSTARFAQMSFSVAQTTGGVIGVKFVSGAPTGTTGLPYTDNTVSIDAISPTGYWNIERISGAGGTYSTTVDATGFTKGDGVTVITALSSIRLVKRPTGGTWGTTGSEGTAAAPVSLNAVTRSACTTFSDFAIGGTAAALPLELASFTGKTQSTTNMLLWETLTEKNVQYHIVERSIDGIQWTEVGRKAGQMDSQSSLKYELEDRTPLAKAYYRLRSIDFDGAENLSSSILLTRKGDHFGITAAFPSPTKDKITVQFASLTEENVTIRITDVTGRLVLEQRYAAESGINEVPVQLNGLQAGMYLVSIHNATAVTAPVRIIKE